MKSFLSPIRRFLGWTVKEFKMFLNPIEVKFYNHWAGFFYEIFPHKLWFYRLIKNRGITNKITFFSVDGYRWFMKFFRGKKVFYAPEFLQQGGINKNLLQFSDHCVDEVDLSMGYDYIDHPHYVRLPLWILFFVQPEMTFEDLEKRIDQINDPAWRLNADRDRFAVQISTHDINGIRGKLVQLTNTVEKVTCAGKFMNTTDELITKYGDDKWVYLRKFRFNICPENASSKGYITEKILDAFVGGCIPIYWGGGKKEWIEPEIFNQEAFLYYEEGKEDVLLSQIKELWTNQEAYQKFVSVPPFKKDAAKILWAKVTEVENRLRNL